MKKFAIYFSLFFFFGISMVYGAEVQDYRKVKCVPTYANPCTDLADPYGTGTGDFGPGAGGIANKNNADPKDVLEGLATPLKLYNGGLQVEALQRLLIINGFLTGTPDGKFGTKTSNAVRALQKVNKLKIDGVAGPKTIEVLLGKSTGTTNNTNTNTSGGSTTNNSSNKNTTSGSTISGSTSGTETITLITKKSKNTFLKNYACKESKKEKLFVFTGEVMDEVKNSLYAVSDVWSTVDGVNWSKEASDTKMGANWEKMVVKIKEGGKDTVYSFGSKYTPKGANDNAVYKSTNMVDWTYVGEMPDFSRFYDKSIVYYKNAFWAIASEATDPNTNSVTGIWKSTKGDTWSKMADVPWDGKNKTTVYNNNGSKYDSNSLGAFVLDGKMWYLVYDKGAMTIFSSTDGKKWTNHGKLVDSKTKSRFDIGTNTNPFPVLFKNEIYIMSTEMNSMKPVTIKTSNGTSWTLVTNTKDRSNATNGLLDTDYAPGYYSSDVEFMDKLWKIGGLNNTTSNDNAVYSSKDGDIWDKVTIDDNDTFPGPEDRHLAGAVVLDSVKSKSTNLEIKREYNTSSFFTGSDQKDVVMGQWNLVANSGKNTANTGPITITSLSFVGNAYKSSTGKEISTLETLENLTLYIDGVKVGSVAKFSAPYFESTGSKLAVAKTITLDKPFTLQHNDSVWLKLTADSPTPKYKNIEYRTFLNGITFKDGNTTPCLVYTEDTANGYEKVPGRNIYWKNY